MVFNAKTQDKKKANWGGILSLVKQALKRLLCRNKKTQPQRHLLREVEGEK